MQLQCAQSRTDEAFAAILDGSVWAVTHSMDPPRSGVLCGTRTEEVATQLTDSVTNRLACKQESAGLSTFSTISLLLWGYGVT